ncbi:hypothetical protein [Neptunicella sp. SCSIO 80796]|uniref:hypothetical protein n=1 Tax=Neptunicella plasticusilytica TaxID=3117012 RepID=UPI003A4DB7C1
MGKVAKLVFNFVTIFGLLMISPNALAEQVLWLKSLSGVDAKQQKSIHINESSIQLIRQFMPKMNFTEVLVNNRRAYSILASEPNACTGNKLKTSSRMEQYYFSDLPQSLSAGLRLFVIKDSELDRQLTRLYPGNQQVSVEQILQHDSLKVLGVVGGRSYGNKLDSVLTDKAIQTKLWSRTSSDMFIGLLKMLLRNRLQAIVEYPSVVNRYDKTLFENIELVSYPIKEAPEMGLGYIMCSKTQTGLALIAEFNRALELACQTPEYYQLHWDWNGQLSEGEFRHLYTKVYPTIKEPIE